MPQPSQLAIVWNNMYTQITTTPSGIITRHQLQSSLGIDISPIVCLACLEVFKSGKLIECLKTDCQEIQLTESGHLHGPNYYPDPPKKN